MNSTGSGRPERLAGGVITTEAAAAMLDGVLAAEMAADQDPQPGARAAAGLFGELQRHAVGGHDVVAPDGAFGLDAEDLVEIDAARGYEGGGGVGRRPGELGVEGGEEVVAHIAIGRGDGGDAGDAQFVDEAVLRSEERRVGKECGSGWSWGHEEK